MSILMIAFNRERYIAQAIESVLAQEAPFAFELVIGEDCSTDATLEICLEYQRSHPETIRVLRRTENVGPVRNYALTWKACRGKYIALLDADDYWTSEVKLRRQVEMLEERADAALCFHNVLIVDERAPENQSLRIAKKIPEVHTLLDVISTFRISTCSAVCRNGLFAEFPPWYFEMPTGDWPLFVLNAEHGDAIYIDEVMAAYRRHSGGYWTSMRAVTRLEENIGMLAAVNRHLKGRYVGILGLRICIMHYRVAVEYLSEHRYRLALRHFLHFAFKHPFLLAKYHWAGTAWLGRWLAPGRRVEDDRAA